jgi:hypothetical protein
MKRYMEIVDKVKQAERLHGDVEGLFVPDLQRAAGQEWSADRALGRSSA